MPRSITLKSMWPNPFLSSQMLLAYFVGTMLHCAGLFMFYGNLIFMCSGTKCQLGTPTSIQYNNRKCPFNFPNAPQTVVYFPGQDHPPKLLLLKIMCQNVHFYHIFKMFIISVLERSPNGCHQSLALIFKALGV